MYATQSFKQIKLLHCECKKLTHTHTHTHKKGKIKLIYFKNYNIRLLRALTCDTPVQVRVWCISNTINVQVSGKHTFSFCLHLSIFKSVNAFYLFVGVVWYLNTTRYTSTVHSWCRVHTIASDVIGYLFIANHPSHGRVGVKANL